MKKIIILIMLMFIACAMFAQADTVAGVSGLTPPVLAGTDTNQQILTDLVARILATLLTALIGWLCLLINKYLNIKIMSGQVTGLITTQAKIIDDQKISNTDKCNIVIEKLKAKPKVSKWATILHGGLEEAIDVVYKTVVKKVLKG